jgi:uncharacterized protein
MSVRECDLGRGLFADHSYKTGDVILKFEGRTVPAQVVAAMGDEQCYMIQIGPDLYFEPEEPGRYTNHSCAPNAAIKDDYLLIALKDIQPGEQICFDYSTTMSEDNWTMECRCGASNCRGTIKDFGELPPDLQHRYLDMGVVQSFIVAERMGERRRAG